MMVKGRLSSAHSLVILVLIAVVFAPLTGCGKPAPPSARPIDRDPNLLVVYCACGLMPAVEAARDDFLAASPDKKVEITSGEPRELVARVQNGEVPDVFVCRGEAEIGELEWQGHLDRSTRHAMGGLTLVIAVPRGNPAQIHGMEDLTSERVRRIAISTPGLTSLGSAAERELERAGVWESLQEKITVKQRAIEVLEVVTAGEVDAALIYSPCLGMMPQEGSAAVSEGMPDEESEDATEIPEPATDPIEIVSPVTSAPETRIYTVAHKRSPNGLLAQRFIRELAAEIDGESETDGDAVGEPTAEADSEAPA